MLIRFLDFGFIMRQKEKKPVLKIFNNFWVAKSFEIYKTLIRCTLLLVISQNEQCQLSLPVGLSANLISVCICICVYVCVYMPLKFIFKFWTGFYQHFVFPLPNRLQILTRLANVSLYKSDAISFYVFWAKGGIVQYVRILRHQKKSTIRNIFSSFKLSINWHLTWRVVPDSPKK